MEPALRSAKSSSSALRVLALSGGPDREREVSLNSGRNVAQALRDAGHHVTTSDITPDHLTCLDTFKQSAGDVIFPVLHGSWGEGGGLQRILDDRGLRYVGCKTDAAIRCMDKHLAKDVMAERGLPTPAYEYLATGSRRSIDLPVVVKAPREGSSIDLAICRTQAEYDAAMSELSPRHDHLLVEQFTPGKEITVGIIPAGNASGEAGRPTLDGYVALPAIHIVPATAYYDYQAKYTREDTQYRFDIDLPAAVLQRIGELALQAHGAMGCRHLSRVDFMVDANHQPWILEINTIPGFTSHSLLPMAARRVGLEMPALVDRLVHAAMCDA